MSRYRYAPLALLPACLALAQCDGEIDLVPAPPATTIEVVEAFPALRFTAPIAIAQAPGDASRMFVATQSGVVYVFPNVGSTPSATVYLDIGARVTDDGGEQGLLGMAFDPGYAANGLFYVHYSPNFDGTTTFRRSQVSRFLRATADTANPASEDFLLDFQQPATRSNHKGGWIGFGPDAKLYVSSGDGGGANDPDNNAQNTGNLLGKILRINSDGSIPPDNPFVGVAGADEIWAFGLRNPFRGSFDRGGTNELIVGDVGQDAREEIDVIVKGGNYGWRKFEGTRTNTADPIPDFASTVAPIYEYAHTTDPCSGTVIGGHVYRGSALAGYAGAYFYADFCSGDVFTLRRSGGSVTRTLVGNVPGNPTSFGEDLAGELYVTSLDGNVYKLVPES